jgi:hypothetical protein
MRRLPHYPLNARCITVRILHGHPLFFRCVSMRRLPIGRLPVGRLPMHLWTLVLYSVVSFLDTSTLFQTILSLSLVVTRSFWWSVPLTQRHWHRGSCDIRGFAGCLTARRSHFPLQYSRVVVVWPLIGSIIISFLTVKLQDSFFMFKVKLLNSGLTMFTVQVTWKWKLLPCAWWISG